MRAMRKSERQITQDETLALLENGQYGILSLLDADNLPYGLPLSYVFTDGQIYIHCAPEGRKLDGLRAHPAVSFCVVGATQTLPEKFTTRYESVIVTGTAREIKGEQKEAALMALVRKYSPQHVEKGAAYVQSAADKACAFAIAVEAVTGKARR